MFNDYSHSFKDEYDEEEALVKSFIACCKAGDDDGADELRYEGVDDILGYELAISISSGRAEEIENFRPLVERRMEERYYALAYDL